ncbi:eCIS core domain-containing protein [Pseudomonas sp. BMS12]|uniref:eCIS core domain-containing protein n=1 Tax=Pseudomonas sp. BMS12 TaxID=1796033 RepID=UPI0009EEDE3C|nr:DUF4157 domain-containing protein [Pseudomonas sp. BMS12]
MKQLSTESSPAVASGKTARTAQDSADRRFPAEALIQAAKESASPLPPPLVQRLGAHLSHDFSQVRVHSGRTSMAAAEQLGARAYTLGRDIHLGSEAAALACDERLQLLAHEAIHTAQQGGDAVAPGEHLSVSHPSDPAEHEAHELAGLIRHMPSPSLAVRDQVLRRVQHRVTPHVQRDLKNRHQLPYGTFKTALSTVRDPTGKSGMSGSIKFMASDTAPDSQNIRLLQVVRVENLDTGKEEVWAGAEEPRNEIMTSADSATGVQEGFFVDHLAKMVSPRTAKTDAAVSPYYRDYVPNFSQDGSKKGSDVNEASLWDSPRSAGKRRFTFETAAKAADSGYVYATLNWGFTVNDPTKGSVSAEHAIGELEPSPTFGAAVAAFDEYYKNPGSSGAPSE